MTILNVLVPYLLQADTVYFKKRDTDSDQVIILVIFIAVIVVGLIIFYFSKKGYTDQGGGSKQLFTGFALRRLVRNIDLNDEQFKMLVFVFKTDNVDDPEKSINNPTLLDRHFRRAYRVIKASGNSEEVQNRLFVLFSTRNRLENVMIGGLTSTRQLKDDVSLTFNYGNNKIKANIISARTEHLTVEAPRNALGSLIKIPKGTRLSVLFFTRSNKGFSFETRVIGISDTNRQPALQLAHSNQLRFLSQRRFRRRSAVIACFLFLVYVEGSGKKQHLVVDKRRLNGNIADISVGGCSIKTTALIKVGAMFRIEFTQDDNNVAALGQVLRTNQAGASTIIHVRFLKVSKTSMNVINTFVYEYAHE